MITKKYSSYHNEDAKVNLWRDFKLGNNKALGGIYDLYINELFSYGLGQTKDRAYVMDCIHDVFLDLYKYRSGLANTDNVKYYLFKCLKRRIHRKKSPKVIPLQPELVFNNKTEQKIASNSIEETLIAMETSSHKRKKLTKALNTLSKKQKDCILMRYAKDIPYEEIAQTMNVSVQSARTIVYRGIKSLRKHSLTLLLFINIFSF